jgi:hypothetical protein
MLELFETVFTVNRDPLPKLRIAGAPLAAKIICNLFDLSSHLVFKVRMNPLPFALFQPSFLFFVSFQFQYFRC